MPKMETTISREIGLITRADKVKLVHPLSQLASAFGVDLSANLDEGKGRMKVFTLDF
jgi:hypothetical protein